MRDTDCIFCKIANGEIKSETLYEDDEFRVILDLGPASCGHALILTKDHYKDICELDEKLAAKMLPLAARIGRAMKSSLGCSGFNLVQNNGISAGQTVFHVHMHIIPRYDNGPEMVTWKQNDISIEELHKIASKLKSAIK